MVQSFNRIDDPVLDQSGSKLLGAAAGGYAGWKHHSNVARNRGLLSKVTAGFGTGPVMRPVRTLAGAGLGALGAGLLARYFNKKHADRQERKQLEARGMLPPNLYQRNLRDDSINAGMQTYDEYGPGGDSYDDFDFSKYSSFREDRDSSVASGDFISKGIHGGLLGGLGGAILGKSPLKGAGVGALGVLGYDLLKKHKEEQELRDLIMQNYGLGGNSMPQASASESGSRGYY